MNIACEIEQTITYKAVCMKKAPSVVFMVYIFIIFYFKIL